MGFDDPDGKSYESFELCFEDQIKENLLPFIKTYFDELIDANKNIQPYSN